MTYVETQFQGLLETVALFEDIAAVAAAPVDGGVISQVPLVKKPSTLFEEIYKNWHTESTMPIYSPMELMVVANDIQDLEHAGWLNTATNED